MDKSRPLLEAQGDMGYRTEKFLLDETFIPFGDYGLIFMSSEEAIAVFATNRFTERIREVRAAEAR